MNVQVKWNGTDITNSVIEYSREQNICDGIGTLDLNVEAKTVRGFNPWDTIEVYENGNKMHTYNIASIEETVPEGIYVVTCQDDSKRLTDYFIDQQYEITYPSSSKYWIELFLNLAGVTYHFNTSSSGNTVAETTLGAASAYDTIINLLQLNGWYFYFDSSNVCQIGKLNINATSPAQTFYGDDIIEIGYNKNDKMLRNRVVVWGAGDPETQTWVYADTSTITGWNRPGRDYRTVVYSNPAIKTFGIAYYLAFLILNEFSQTIPEDDLIVIGSYSNVEVGSYIEAYTDWMYIDGVVTHIVVNMSSEGLTTAYNLDQRCPRLFGYANWNDWVYIGTQGNGVWRKYILGSTWNNYSTGITDLNIKDLSAYDGLLGTISTTITPGSGVGSGIAPNPIIDSQLYVRHTSLASWFPYNPGGFWNYYPASGAEPEYLTSGIIAEACSIDRTYGVNGLVTAAYTIPGSGAWTISGEYYAPSGNLSWIVGLTADRVPLYTQQIVITTSGYLKPSEIAVIDMDTNWNGQNMISAYHGMDIWDELPPYSGNITRKYDFGDIPAEGMLHGFTTLPYTLSNWQGTQGKTIKTMVPPPTNGLALMLASGEMQSGYRLLPSITIERIGGIIFLDDTEYDGHAYGKGLDINGYFVDEYLFDLSNGTWLPSGLSNWYTHNKYYWDDVTGFSSTDAIIYCINNNLFSLSYIPEFNCSFFHSFLDLDRINYTAIIRDITETVICDNLSSGPQFYWPSFNICAGPGRYVLITYRNTNIQGGYAVADRITGEVKNYGSITKIVNSGYDIALFSGKGTPNHAFATLLTRDGSDFEIQLLTLNIHTGDVNVQTINYTSVGPGIPTNSDSTANFCYPYRYTTAGNNYIGSVITAACENPDTGNGIAHLFCILEHHRTVDHVFPEEDEHFVVNTFFDVVFNTNGGSIETRIYDDVWDKSTAPYTLISSSIPNWVRNPADSLYYPGYTTICSRFSENNPSVKVIYDGTYKIALVSPTDPTSVIAEFDKLPGDYGYSGEREVKHAFSMTDSIDDTLYTHVEIASGGTYPITVGYDWEGHVKKVLFPSPNAEPFGAPLHDKIILHDGILDGKIWFYLPVMLESGRRRIETEYLILKHSPTASGELLPSGIFDVIYKGLTPLNIDTSKDIPTVIYDLPGAFLVGSGTAGSGISIPATSSSHIGMSYLNEPGSFTITYPNAPVFDARTFDLAGSLDMFPASGIASGIFGRFVGVAGGQKGLIMYNTESFNNNYAVVHSGYYTHLDFTNTFPDPYMFASSPNSGVISGRFLQRNTEEYLWNDYSATLPSGVITIIRADDRM